MTTEELNTLHLVVDGIKENAVALHRLAGELHGIAHDHVTQRVRALADGLDLLKTKLDETIGGLVTAQVHAANESTATMMNALAAGITLAVRRSRPCEIVGSGSYGPCMLPHGHNAGEREVWHQDADGVRWVRSLCGASGADHGGNGTCVLESLHDAGAEHVWHQDAQGNRWESK